MNRLFPTIVLAACALGADAQPGDTDSLSEVYARAFRIGVAAGSGSLDSAHDQTLATHHFNALTLENELKWSSVQPEEGRFDFSPADALVAFAAEHEMAVTGHTFVWHRQTPDWIFEDDTGTAASADLVRERLRAHIHAVAGRYGDRIHEWDVVNEALSDDDDRLLRDTPWLRALGEDYIAHAFGFAHEADPKATLIYNDYGLDDPKKRAKAVRLLQRLQADGVPVHAIGMQSHHKLTSVDPEQVAESIRAFAALGLRVHISELDLSLYAWFDRRNAYPDGAPAELLQRQAEAYRELFRVFLAHQDAIERVTFWGLHDGASWLNHFPAKNRPDYPLLFDRYRQPKPAFEPVISVASEHE